MEDVKPPICRLCLEIGTTGNNFHSLESVSNIIRTVLPNLSMNVSSNTVICNMCKESLQKSYYFTLSCLETEKYLKSFQTTERLILDLEEISSSGKDILKAEDSKIKGIICRLCLLTIEEEPVTEIGEMEEEMLKKCIPEVNTTITSYSVLCELCLEQLHNQFNFVMSCSDTEDKIDNYCVLEGINSESEVNLYGVLHLSLLIEQDQNIHNSQLNENKNRNKQVDYRAEVVKSTMGLDQSVTSGKKENIASFKIASNGLSYQKINIERNMNGHYELYVCPKCPYEAKRRDIIERHIIFHLPLFDGQTFKCSKCHYQTVRMTDYKKHNLIHKTPEEIVMHKCKLCAFQARQKSNLVTHMLTHKNPSETKMYKCPQCDFQTKYAPAVKKHFNNMHRDSSEMKKYDCPYKGCLYQSKQKSHISQHIIHSHKTKMKENGVYYNCALCSFKAKQKDELLTHLQLHNANNQNRSFINVSNVANFPVVPNHFGKPVSNNYY